MNKFLLHVLIAGFCLSSFNAVPQEKGDMVCGTDQYYEQQKRANPDLERLEQIANKRAREYVNSTQARGKRKDEPRVIPVVFHVIHGGGPENLERRQLLDNLERLNLDFQKRNEDTVDVRPVFKDRIGDYNIEFRLATRNPAGECFNGITRDYLPGLTDDSIWLNTLPDHTDKVPYWDPDHYLNIWVVEDIWDNNPNSDVAGQANYPWDEDGADGILMRADQLNYNDRTLTHEVGHYLGLYHPFYHGCSTGDCENQNDKVCDVPSTAERETVRSCNQIGNTCDGAEWRIDSVAILDTATSPKDLSPSQVNANSLFLEDFEDLQSQPWQIFSASSDIDWGYETVDNHQVASIKGHQADTPNNDWLISPALKFNQADSNFYFSFKNVRNSEGGTFSVKISNDYDGQSDPTDSAFHWTDITDEFELSEGFFDNEFTESFDLKTFNQDSFHIAFQYETTEEVHLPDMRENYMDYSNCRRMFSKGQKDRSDAYLYDTQYRQELISDQNLARTGVKNQIDGAPSAYFELEDTEVCQGDPLQFENFSCEGSPDSIEWYFEGGTPETSGSPNPVVQYQQSGTFDVGLKLINDNGTDSLLRRDYVTVLNTPNAPVEYNFERENLRELGFRMEPNALGNRWKLTEDVGAGSERSLYLGNYNINVNQDVAFRTPPVNLSEGENPVLRFDMAHATKSNNSGDVMLLQTSNDCGQTWQHLDLLFTRETTTQSNVSTPYFPESFEEWKTHEVSLDKFSDSNNVLLRFVMQTKQGNNAFIDNIRIERENTSVEEPRRNLRQNFQFYPNPVKNRLNIKFTGNHAKSTQMEIMNTLGQSIYRGNFDWKPGETQSLMSSTLNIKRSGNYIIKIQSNEQRLIRRITFID